MKRRRSFTLIELLLVMLLLTTVTAVGGVQVARAIREQRFLTDVHRVQEILNCAQEITLVSQAETKVTFFIPAGETLLRAQLTTEANLSDSFAKLLEKPSKPLNGIDHLSFRDKTPPVSIRFNAFGNEAGPLTLKGNNQERTFSLAPSPLPLSTKDTLTETFPERLYPSAPFLEEVS